ncbi:MAG: hypothetical protein ACRDPY_05650 [Streptosporangiaceae bacterium]
MTQGNGHVIDPTGDARRVLETAVAERGPGVLSDPATMDGICRARLQGMPGETILVGSAARSNVPALLQQQVGRLGLDAAIQDVAATVARAHQLDTDACLWVVREFARALGYPVPGLPPIAGAGAGGNYPGANYPGANPAAAPFGASSQLYPATQASPSGYPPTPAPGYQQPYQQTPPPLYPPGGTLPQGGRPGGPWYSNRKILGVVAAAAVIAVYFGVAASAHLAPFGKPVAVVTHSPTPTVKPHPSPTFSMPTPSPTPDTSPDAVPTITSDEALWNLIPGTVRTSNCKAITPTDQATEEIACTDAIYNAQTEGGYLYYYLFSSSTTLDSSYTNNFLNPLNISSDEGTCGNFTKFKATCETGWNNTSPVTNGRLAEYLYKGYNTLTWTQEQQHIMVYLSGVNGNQMLSWWLYPGHWVVTGS